MMKIEQVLWDWNGTLLDDLEYSIQVRNNIFPAFHLPTLSGVEEYHRQFTFPVRLYYQRAGVTDEIFDDVAHAWMAEYERRMDTIPLHEDAVETVERFQPGRASADGAFCQRADHAAPPAGAVRAGQPLRRDSGPGRHLRRTARRPSAGNICRAAAFRRRPPS